MGRKLTLCYIMAFCKIEFYGHVPELLNKKVRFHSYHLYPELGHIFQP